MKKILTFLIVLSFSISASANGINANVVYDADKSILSVSGNASDDEPLYFGGISTAIYPSGTDAVTTEDINSLKTVVYSDMTDANGNFSFELNMPDGLDSGKYTVKLSDGTSTAEYYIIHADLERAKEALKNINAASSENFEKVLGDYIEDIGADKNEYEKYSSDIAEYVYRMKQSGGYKVSELLEVYISSMAVNAIKKDDMTLERAISDYASYLGINAETEYSNYDENTKKEIENIVKSTVLDKNTKIFYKECRLLALARKAESYSALKEIVLGNATELEINLDKYNKLSEYNRDEVFRDMYKSSFNEYEDIKSAFDTAVANAPKDSGSGGSSGGGSGSGASKSNAVNSSFSNTVPQTGKIVFADMSVHWAKENVEMLYKKGIISGYPDGNFKPENYVTRAEFAKMLKTAFDISDGTAAEFADVSVNDWYYSCVNALAESGIITGFNGKFMPNELISRQDAAVMTERALKSKGIIRNGEYDFADLSDIADYALDSVMNMASCGVITGDNGYFRPNGYTTRAEAATMIIRALSAAGKGE